MKTTPGSHSVDLAVSRIIRGAPGLSETCEIKLKAFMREQGAKLKALAEGNGAGFDSPDVSPWDMVNHVAGELVAAANDPDSLQDAPNGNR